MADTYHLPEEVTAQYRFMTKVVTIIWFAMPLLLSVAPIAIGAIYFHHCTVQKMIPVSLITMGLILLFFALTWVPLLCIKSEYQFIDTIAPPSIRYLRIFNLLGYLLLLAWLVISSVWVFDVSPDFMDIKGEKYCHEVLYHFAFYFTITMYVVIFLFIPVSFCLYVKHLEDFT